MNEPLHGFLDFARRSGEFVCDAARIAVHNVIQGPASEAMFAPVEAGIGRRLSNQHRAFLLQCNGIVLFQQNRTPDASRAHCRSGAELYGVEKLAGTEQRVIAEIQEWMETGLPDCEEEERDYVKGCIEDWLPQLLVVGEELGSGNYLAMDFSRLDEGEPRIVFLDHELPGNGPDQVHELAPSLFGLLALIQEDPAVFLNRHLGACTRFDLDGKDHFPRAYLIADGEVGLL